MNIPIGLFLFTLFFYLRTLCATFNINDSGETIMDCNNLAIAHAPGYPLHTLLGRIFCLLPLGQPMFRLTFASAVMGALATVMVYLVLRKILKNIPTSGQSQFFGGDSRPLCRALLRFLLPAMVPILRGQGKHLYAQHPAFHHPGFSFA
jgi:hypothetical protein